MANDPFTIKMFVPDGDPEGIRIINRMNWTGLGIVFPREKWKEACQRTEFGHPGVYILVGHSDDEESNLPQVYVGEGDVVRDRVNSHFIEKDFWSWGVAFVATDHALNKAHAQWLEYALVKTSKEVGRSRSKNGNTPQEPALSESEKADTRAFLKGILQILPLVGLRAFEAPKIVAAPKTKTTMSVQDEALPSPVDRDTIVVPARVDGFEEVFIGESCWYAVRISGGMLAKIRWIAGYQSAPISAITHIAPVRHIEPYGDGTKYKIVFSEPAKSISPIPFADAPIGSMNSSRYTNYTQLLKAKKLTDIFRGA